MTRLTGAIYYRKIYHKMIQTQKYFIIIFSVTLDHFRRRDGLGISNFGWHRKLPKIAGHFERILININLSFSIRSDFCSSFSVEVKILCFTVSTPNSSSSSLDNPSAPKIYSLNVLYN